MAGLVVEQEVGWLDIAMDDATSMTVVQGSEKATHVLANVRWIQISEEQLYANFGMIGSKESVTSSEKSDSHESHHWADTAY